MSAFNIPKYLKKEKDNKNALDNFYEASEIFNYDLNLLAVAFILIEKKIKKNYRPNMIYEHTDNCNHRLLNDYSKYLISLKEQELKIFKSYVLKNKTKILNRSANGIMIYPIFKQDFYGNIYKFSQEDKYDVVLIENEEKIKQDRNIYDDDLMIVKYQEHGDFIELQTQMKLY